MLIYDPEYYAKLFTEGKTDIREILASRKKLFDDEVFMQEKCKQFIAGSTFGEYEADIVRYLVLCSWLRAYHRKRNKKVSILRRTLRR